MKSLRSRIETALLSHFTANVAGTAIASVSVVTGQTEGDLPDECVILYAENATPSDPLMADHGNSDVGIRVMVMSNANDTSASVHADRVQAAREIMRLAPSLTAALTAQSVGYYNHILTDESEGREGDRFGNSLNYRMPVVDNPAG